MTLFQSDNFIQQASQSVALCKRARRSQARLRFLVSQQGSEPNPDADFQMMAAQSLRHQQRLDEQFPRLVMSAALPGSRPEIGCQPCDPLRHRDLTAELE